MQKKSEPAPQPERPLAFPLEIAFSEAEGVLVTLHADGTVTGDYRKFVNRLRALGKNQNPGMAIHLWTIARALAQQNGLTPLDV